MAALATAPPLKVDRVLYGHALALLEREGMAGAEVWRIEPGPVGWRLLCSWRAQAFICDVERVDPREWTLRSILAGWPV